MENSPASSTLSLALWAVATPVLSVLSALVSHFLSKPRQSAEMHKTGAETAKTEAEARQIDSAILTKAYERLDKYEDIRQHQSEIIATLENRNFELEYTGRVKDAESRRLNGEIELLNLQVQKARAQGFLEDRAPHSPNPAA